MELNNLPTEVLYNILLKVDYCFLLTNCALVSHNWKNIITHNDFIIHYCREMIEGYPRNTSRSQTEIEFCQTYFKTKQNKAYIPIKAISASSTDHLSQHVAFTIAEYHKTFWSSTGSRSDEDNELIVYEIGMGIGIIKFMRISFFQANWLPSIDGNNPCFSSKSLRIEILNERGEKIYKSSIFNVVKTNHAQTFHLPKPFFVTEGYKIHLHLMGKAEKQLSDNLYYTCVNNFAIFGISSLAIPFRFTDGNFTKYTIEEYRFAKHIVFNSKNLLLSFANLITRTPHIINNPRMPYYLEHLGKLNSRRLREMRE